uniref:Uncharacterized protein n=1 Tax=uncultured marine microorganism HF4000_APKG8C21 TaxID=455553 RepID=B3TA13_9ZZZZ|nr:hypothetical protein ALOHA_HF4000APKG8C21ctg1g10 [uncultured marine microorganism HF4000_APKG8C21]
MGLYLQRSGRDLARTPRSEDRRIIPAKLEWSYISVSTVPNSSFRGYRLDSSLLPKPHLSAPSHK